MHCAFKVELPPAAANRYKINFNLCLLCQKRKKEPHVRTKKSQVKLLDTLKRKVDNGYGDYQFLSDLFETNEIDALKQKSIQWHLSCYKNCLRRDVSQLENIINEPETSTSQVDCSPSEIEQNHDKLQRPNRTSSALNNPSVCFFCENPQMKNQPLTSVSSTKAGEKICEAIYQSGNEDLILKLSGFIDPKNANMSYHKECYQRNVFNVLRSKKLVGISDSPLKLEDENSERPSEMCQIKCAVEQDFLNCIKGALLEGKVLTMALAEIKYQEIARSYGVSESDMLQRRSVKSLIENELFHLGIEFTNSTRKNRPQLISLKKTKDVFLSNNAEEGGGLSSTMRSLFKSAMILRNLILKAQKWKFTGSIEQENVKSCVPMELKMFVRFCIAGGATFGNTSIRNDLLGKKVDIISQNIIYECLSDKQAASSCTLTTANRHKVELPLQVAVGLTIHAKTRSKFLVELIHDLGMSIDYAKVLRIETQIASEMIQRISDNGGVWLPTNIVKDRFTYYAADNLDFLEDTNDGKGTLHATVMVCYQESSESDKHECLHLTTSSKNRSLTNIPCFMTDFVQYDGAKKLKPKGKTFEKKLMVESSSTDLKRFSGTDIVWLFCKCSEWMKRCGGRETDFEEHTNNNDIGNDHASSAGLVPTWSAFNSCITSCTADLPLASKTTIGLLPIIPASPTDRSVQLTFLNQLERVNQYISGPNSKCIVTLDVGLYQPVQQLIMSRLDLQNRWILRPGELHIAFAILRAIGVFIDGTGIPEIWEVLYGENTIHKILHGKHFRRSLEAHTRMLVALQNFYFKLFFEKHSEVYEIISRKVKSLNLKLDATTDVTEGVGEILTIIEEKDILKLLDAFDEETGMNNPTFKMIRKYMKLVEWLLLFIRSVRSGNWELHLACVEYFIKYFFALDLFNYSRMLSLYIAEMKEVKRTNPAVWEQFQKGNWVVRKTQASFCALGADEALEQENRTLKVSGGIVGITQHPKALARYFLTSAELLKTAHRTMDMISSTNSPSNFRHHLNSPTKTETQNAAISKIYNEIARLGDPFTLEGPDLVNIVTKEVFSPDIARDVDRVESLGTKLYESFKNERLIDGTINFWDGIKRNQLKLCSSTKKKVKLDTKSTVNEISADRSLFARFLIISRSQREIDLRSVMGEYELSAVPRSMFNLDGTMHQCQAKSQLIHILKATCNFELGKNNILDDECCVAIIDGMAELHAVNKTSSIRTCEDLAKSFVARIQNKYWKYDHIHLIFDTYKKESIKTATRQKRLQDMSSTQYKVSDTTNIANVSLKKFLSHNSTKDQMTEYLSKKILNISTRTGKNVVVSWRDQVRASMPEMHPSLSRLMNSQEEADTKIILHSIYAKDMKASKLLIFAQDTDVLVLSVSWYCRLPSLSCFVPNNRDIVNIGDIHKALGQLKSEALLGFHAISGCDTTGILAGKGKASFWKAFVAATENQLEALKNLGRKEALTLFDQQQLESFICRVYLPKSQISELAELRWHLFAKRQLEGTRLPPTVGGLLPALKRANYQAMIWQRSDIPHQNMPPPTDHGWTKCKDNGDLSPIICDKPCAPDSLLHLVKCSCQKNRCVPPCKCATYNLRCTEMCSCNGDYMNCDNRQGDRDEEYEDEEFNDEFLEDESV